MTGGSLFEIVRIFFFLCPFLSSCEVECDDYFPGKHSKKSVVESAAMTRAIVEVRATLRSILSDPLLGQLDRALPNASPFAARK